MWLFQEKLTNCKLAIYFLLEGKLVKLTSMLVGLFVLAGCASPTSLVKQSNDINNAQSGGTNLTAGLVQKDIKIGMSSTDVVTVLGSPNMVTTDEKRRQSWVYDKVSTEAFVSGSRGFGFLFVPEDVKATSSTTQKTLTIVIKFDENEKVRDFAYHSTKF